MTSILTASEMISLLQRVRLYIGNPSDHPSSRQSPRNELIADINRALAALQQGGGDHHG